MYLVAILWTLKDVSLFNNIEELIVNITSSSRVRESEDEEEFHISNDSILYFSLKILMIYEFLVEVSNGWSLLVVTHFGLIQHLIVVVRNLALLLLTIPPFFQSAYVLLHKNFPTNKELDKDIKTVTLIEGVLAILSSK